MKRKRETDRKYLKWVKSLPCTFQSDDCFGPIDPHHTVPRSIGGSDRTALPLCRKHHDRYQFGTEHSVTPGFREVLKRLANKLFEEYSREVQTTSRASRQQPLKSKREVLLKQSEDQVRKLEKDLLRAKYRLSQLRATS